MPLLLAILLNTFLCCYSHASGFLVDPSFIKAQNIAVNIKTPLGSSGGFFLSITNPSPQPQKYTVEILTCKQCGKIPNPGYEDVPTLTWFSTSTVTVLAAPNSVTKVTGISVTIPMPSRPFVHKWQAIVKVRKLPQKGDTIATEVVLPLWLEIKR